MIYAGDAVVDTCQMSTVAHASVDVKRPDALQSGGVISSPAAKPR